MITVYLAEFFHAVAVVFLEMVLPALALVVAIGIWLQRRHMILLWHGGGVDKELNLARCHVCGRQITRCEHDMGAREGTWEHYDDSTHLHADGTPVTHR